MRFWTISLAIAGLICPVLAEASHCDPVFVAGDQTVVIDGIEIEPGAFARETFTVRVQDAGGSSGGSADTGPGNPNCPATIRVARFAPSPHSSFPNYILGAPGNRQIEILPDLTTVGSARSDISIANIASGPNGRSVQFSVELGTEWGLPAGTYTEQLQLSLIGHDGQVSDQANLTITIVIPSALSLRLVGAVVGSSGEGPARIELGDLSPTTQTRADRFGALIFSTAPYTVTFSSINGGSLRHEQGSGEIAYRLYFNGDLVDLAGGNMFVFPKHTPKTGDRHPMEIEVPPVTALAGRYSDRVSVTATAM